MTVNLPYLLLQTAQQSLTAFNATDRPDWQKTEAQSALRIIEMLIEAQQAPGGKPP